MRTVKYPRATMKFSSPAVAGPWKGHMKHEVWYHRTCVVTIYEDAPEPGHKLAELYTGGHYTATTKQRMNQALYEHGFPYQVFQQTGAWYIFNTETLEEFAYGSNPMVLIA